MQRALQRPRGERGAEAARDAILNAAQEIFARDGFSGARVDDIAQTAGYNKALIFHYFGDKLGLYRTLMLRTKQSLVVRFEETFGRVFAGDSEPVTQERIRTLAAEVLEALFDFAAEHPQAVRIMAWEAAEGWHTFVTCAPLAPDTWPRRAVALLERARAAGVVRAELDPRLLFTTLISLPLIHMVSLPRFASIFPDTDFSSPAAIAHAREQLTDLVLRGILTSTQEHADTPAATITASSETSHSGQTAPAHPTEEA